MSEEEKKAIKTAKCIRAGIPVGTCNDDYIVLLNLIEKQQKLIYIFIHNEAVKEGKDFNEIKEKYYECL